MSVARTGVAFLALTLASACSHGAVPTVPDVAVLRVATVPEGSRITDTRLPLEALPPPDDLFDEVVFAIDTIPVAVRHAAPWGWGDGGARFRDAGELSFGVHEIQVSARTKRGRALAAVLHLVYESPFASVPSYARDIAPIFRVHCASCHDRGLASDLATYERLRARIPRVRASIREARMPPDFALDAPTIALFTAWCDGYAPP